MIRRPPRSTLFPYTDALPISVPASVGILLVVWLPALRLAGFSHQEKHPHRYVQPSVAGQAPVAVGWYQTPKQVLSHLDRKSTRLNSSHANISYAVFCLKKKTK